MKKILVVLIAIFICSYFLISCSKTEKKAQSTNDAISFADTLETVKEKEDYLISQAKAFYSSEEFQQAIDIAQYILVNLDEHFQPAKDLIEDAKSKLEETVKQGLKEKISF